MRLVISYDIPDDKRRTKIMKILKDFGQHVQYSVFECDLKRADLARLRQKLKAIFQPGHDNIRFYYLCQDDWQKRQIWGDERVETEVRPFYVVGGKEKKTS